MVVVLLGCVGPTAGVAFGTLFSGYEVMTIGMTGNHLVTVGGHPMGSCILFGLVAGLSAALGFLVPPRSRRSAASTMRPSRPLAGISASPNPAS
jgi:hypothetical protein